MRLVRSCGRVKKGKDLEEEGSREQGQESRIWPGSGESQKNLENSGNKLRGNLVSSIAFP
jgi:hypothetical protein